MSSRRLGLATSSFVLLGALLAPLPTATATSVAQFEYTLGSTLQGAVEFRCDAPAASVRTAQPGSLLLTADRWTLRVVDTWNNYTLVAPDTGTPVHLGLARAQTEGPIELAPGPLRIDWQAGSRIVTLGTAPGVMPRTDFVMVVDTQSLELGPVLADHGLGTIWAKRGGEIERTPVESGPGTRAATALGGSWQTSGPLVFVLESVVLHPNASQPVAVNRGAVQTEGGPGARVVHEHFRHAVLEAGNLRAEFAADAVRPLCRSATAAVAGTATAHAATGTIDLPAGQQPFASRELTLDGTFTLEESIAPGQGAADGPAVVRADVTGDFQAVLIDHTLVGSDIGALPGIPLEAVAGAGLLAVAVGLALKFVAPLFARLRSDEVLEFEDRRRIYDAILARPGIKFGDLCARTDTNASSLRYHLEFLQRHGRIRVLKVKGRRRYLASEEDLEKARLSFLLEGDPKLHSLMSRVRSGPRPAREIVNGLRHEWGLSRSGSWRVIERAHRERLIHKDRSGSEVLLRPAVEAA